MTMDIFEVEFHAWSIMIYARMDSFNRKKLHCQREEANEQNLYVVGIGKRTAA